MPKDIKLVWSSDYNEGDLETTKNKGDIETDETLETAVIISLFTDRRADIDDPLPNPDNDDRKGWWGDLASPDIAGDQIGSKLWLLERSKTTSEILADAKEYAEEALQWMIDDSIAENVEVDVERRIYKAGDNRLYFRVKIYKPDGTIVPLEFEDQWIAQKNSTT